MYAKGKHVVISAVERSSIRDTAALLKARKWEVTTVGVDAQGLVDPEEVRRALRKDTVLVAVQMANGEVGTIQPVGAIGKICARQGVLFHVDATASAAWLPINVEALDIHTLSLSSHHMFGPMGIGALYARREDPAVPITPLLTGGGTERGLRAGTPNLPGAVGLGRAAELCRQEMHMDAGNVRELRDRLERGILARSPSVEVLGNTQKRLPNVSAFTVPEVDGEDLVLEVPEVAFAAGAASASDQSERSHVLTAMGLTEAQADSTVRFGLGRATTEAEIDAASGRIISAIAKLRMQGGRSHRPRSGLHQPGGGPARS
jgi:cysteine desulfurase